MKKFSSLLVMLALALALGFVLAGCESALSEPETVGAQTYLNTGGDAFVEYNGNLTVEMQSGNSSIRVGQIVDGKLTLELPQNVTPLNTWATGLTVSPSETRILTRSSFDLKDGNGADFGYLMYRYDIWGENTDIEERLNQFWFVYCSNGCTVSGTTSREWNGVTITQEYRITAKQGWNYIYHKGERKSPTTFLRIITTDISSAPKEMKWSITPY